MNALSPIAATPALDADEQFLASRYGPDFREVLHLAPKGSRPFAEQDDSAFWGLFAGTEPFDAAPDLTAYNRSVAGMAGVAP